MKVIEFGNDKSDLILIQMVDRQSITTIDSEVELIRKLYGRDDFRLVAVSGGGLEPGSVSLGGTSCVR